MRPFEYYLLEEERKKRGLPADDRSLDMLMSPGTGPTVPIDLAQGIINESDSRSQAIPLDVAMNSVTVATAPPPAPQRVDPETLNLMQRQNRPQNPLSIPDSVRTNAKMQGLFANLQSLGRSMGQRGRTAQADPNAGARASSAVMNEYINRQQAAEKMRQDQEALRQNQEMNNLRRRQIEASLAPKPVDKIKQATDYYKMIEAKGKAGKLEREEQQAGTAEERKKELVDMINAAMGKPVASMSMDERTLNGMASDIGLDPLKLRRAKAAGGIGGGVGGTGISRKESPRLASAVEKSMVSDADFINDPNKREAYQILASKEDLSKSESRLLDGMTKEAGDNKERLIKKADKWIVDFNDPEKNTAQMFEAINELKAALARHPDVPGWNEITSSIENIGDFGQWVIDLKNVNDPAARDIMNAIRRYKEAYARAASGAAIGQLEWTNFARQLGAGAFSSPQALRSGLGRAERVLKTAVTRAYEANVDPRLRGYGEWSTPVQPYLMPSKQAAQSVADKYRRTQ